MLENRFSISKVCLLETAVGISDRGGSRHGRMGRSPPPKTYESNFFHHNFAQFRKQHSRYKAIFSSLVLSHKCCEVHLISLTTAKPLRDLTAKYYWNCPPTPKLTGWIRPWLQDPPLIAGSAPDCRIRPWLQTLVKRFEQVLSFRRVWGCSQRF